MSNNNSDNETPSVLNENITEMPQEITSNFNEEGIKDSGENYDDLQEQNSKKDATFEDSPEKPCELPNPPTENNAKDVENSQVKGNLDCKEYPSLIEANRSKKTFHEETPDLKVKDSKAIIEKNIVSKEEQFNLKGNATIQESQEETSEFKKEARDNIDDADKEVENSQGKTLDIEKKHGGNENKETNDIRKKIRKTRTGSSNDVRNSSYQRSENVVKGNLDFKGHPYLKDDDTKKRDKKSPYNNKAGNKDIGEEENTTREDAYYTKEGAQDTQEEISKLNKDASNNQAKKVKQCNSDETSVLLNEACNKELKNINEVKEESDCFKKELAINSIAEVSGNDQSVLKNSVNSNEAHVCTMGNIVSKEIQKVLKNISCIKQGDNESISNQTKHIQPEIPDDKDRTCKDLSANTQNKIVFISYSEDGGRKIMEVLDFLLTNPKKDNDLGAKNINSQGETSHLHKDSYKEIKEIKNSHQETSAENVNTSSNTMEYFAHDFLCIGNLKRIENVLKEVFKLLQTYQHSSIQNQNIHEIYFRKEETSRNISEKKIPKKTTGLEYTSNDLKLRVHEPNETEELHRNTPDLGVTGNYMVSKNKKTQEELLHSSGVTSCNNKATQVENLEEASINERFEMGDSDSNTMHTIHILVEKNKNLKQLLNNTNKLLHNQTSQIVRLNITKISLKNYIRETLQTRVNVLEDRLNTSQMSVSSLDQSLQSSQTTISTLDKKLRSSQARATSLEESLQKTEERATELQEALHMSQAKVASLEEQLQASNKRATNSVSMLDRANEKIIKLEVALEISDKQVTIIKDLMETSAARIASTQKIKEMSETRVTELQSTVDNLKMYVTELKQKVEMSEEGAASLKVKLKMTQARVTELDQKVKMSEEGAASMMDDLKTSQARVIELQAAKEKSDAHVNELEGTLQISEETLKKETLRQNHNNASKNGGAYTTTNAISNKIINGAILQAVKPKASSRNQE